MKKSEVKQPIFIVGAPRSGTTLVAAMLAAHSQLSCGPETRFFHFLAKTNSDRLCASWPDNAVNFLSSIKLVNSVPEHYELAREQIYSYLQDRQPSVGVILSSLTEQFMYREGKQRWIEKSPEHLLYVHNIRSHFPDSPIVRILRDPRDVALSMMNTHFAPNGFLEALLYWRKYDELSAEFFCNDLNCYTLYYENLIRYPAVELRKLCDFIGENFEAQMLDTSRSASRVVTEMETWKTRVFEPIDTSRLYIWKKDLSRDQNGFAEALVGDRLLSYGYESQVRFEREAHVFPSIASLMRFREYMVSFVNQGVRFWHDDGEATGSIMIFVGEPDADGWLRHNRPGRWWDTIRIVLQILFGKITNMRLYWLYDRNSSISLGYCSRLIAFFLKRLGETRRLCQERLILE
jgi:hypothetical protein